MKLTVPDMTCGHCKAAVERALAEAAPGATVAVDLPARRVTVTGATDEGAVLAALAEEGYPETVAG
jgi:copper chaperone